MNRAQLMQLSLTALILGVLLAVAVQASAVIRRAEPPKHYVILVTRIDCSSFAVQGQAQALFDAIPGDPFGLDADKDGRPCEALGVK